MALSHGAVLAAIVVILGGVGYVLLARNLDQQITAELTQAASQQADRIQESGRPIPAPDSDQPSAASTLVAVFGSDGSVVGERDIPAWLRPHRPRVTEATVSDERVRLVTLRTRLPGNAWVSVVAGRSLEPEDELLDRVRWLLLGGGLLAVALSMLAGWFLAGRALRPVRRAYEAQANFAADASHEFRTPLAFVRSGVEVMAEQDPELGEEVLSEVDYLTGLTDRLLTLARADNASLALRPVPVHLLALSAQSIQRNERVNGVSVRLMDSGADGGDMALGDPVVVEAVVDVILENVARHGGGKADLSVTQSDGHVRLIVADHGPGLPSSERAMAFERFYRADPSRAREAGGSGLGLAVARELVVAQRGRMWLEETPGGGVTAVVELPGGPGDEKRGGPVVPGPPLFGPDDGSP
jgi:signal transduction histidine kinase